MCENIRINAWETKAVRVYLPRDQLIYLYADAVVGSYSLFGGVLFQQHAILVDIEVLERFWIYCYDMNIIPDLNENSDFYDREEIKNAEFPIS